MKQLNTNTHIFIGNENYTQFHLTPQIPLFNLLFPLESNETKNERKRKMDKNVITSKPEVQTIMTLLYLPHRPAPQIQHFGF